jgi:arsenite methyltransferase
MPTILARYLVVGNRLPAVSQLEFDADMSQRLEKIYYTRDLLRRRRLVHEALAASPGERILDVGCGPGFYVAEMLERVGPGGSVVGVDASPEMLALAARRSQGHDNVAFHEGDATRLPVDDAGFDAAISVQVLEYVADISAALGEIRRVLRPGGRVLIWDVDWDTVSWHSAEPDRMARVLRAWDEHLAHPSLPWTLTAQLRSAGFADIACEGHAFATNALDPDTYGTAMMSLISSFVPGRAGVSATEAEAWAEEQRALGAAGEFFFACIQFCFTAISPAAP